ncbi:NIPSNAP family protein [Pseudorhodoplanes sp.]|uniref:NIPSNAP family protein n=1 Tax=Pseudorhodoplanes sp. TaxID=1934341 RepID=UPI003D110E92
MLFELRTIAGLPSAMGRVVAAAAGDASSEHGSHKLEGAWTTEIGTLGRLVELRSLPGAAVSTIEPGLAERHTELHDAITGTDNALLSPLLPLQPPSGASHVYELRRYRVRPGHIDEWLRHFVAVMPARERHSARVGLWRYLCGPTDDVLHLWVYDGLDHRAAARAKVMQDPDWQSFLKVGSTLLTEMHSTILLPTAYSPMK